MCGGGAADKYKGWVSKLARQALTPTLSQREREKINNSHMLIDEDGVSIRIRQHEAGRPFGVFIGLG